MIRSFGIVALSILLTGCVTQASSPPATAITEADLAAFKACEEATQALNWSAMILRCGEVEQRPNLMPIRLVRAQIAIGRGLYANKLYPEAIKKFEAVIQHPNSENDLELRKHQAWAGKLRLNVYYDSYRSSEFFPAIEDFVRRYGGETDGYFRALLAEVGIIKGVALHRMNAFPKAIAAYDELIERYRQDTDPRVRDHLILARVNRADAKQKDGQVDTALRDLNDVIAQHQQSGSARIRFAIVRGLLVRAQMLEQRNELSAALADYALVAERYAGDTPLQAREQVAQGAILQAKFLRRTGQKAEAERVVAALINRLANETDPTLRKLRDDALALQASWGQ